MRLSKPAGRDLFYVLRTTTAALLITVAALAGGCGGGEEADSSADEAAEQSTEAVETESTTGSEEGAEHSIGETVVVGDVAWSVTDAEESDILVSRLGSEEGNFIIVDLIFQNNSNQDITFATPFITLVDSEGREFEPDIEHNFTHIEPEQNIFAAHVQPGVTKEGKVIFSVEPDSSRFQLRVGEARFASEKSASIDLGI